MASGAAVDYIPLSAFRLSWSEESVADGVEALLDEVGRLRERVRELEGK